MSRLEKHHFDCSCFSDEHTFTFVIDPDDGELYLSVFLNQYRSFFKRLSIAVKYVFGYNSKYGHWDTTILERDDAARLATLCQRSVEARESYAVAQDEAAKQAVDDMVEPPSPQPTFTDIAKDTVRNIRNWWAV